jgi:ubiquinone/menaquinone biosynthesis C-methylase UbiE
MLTKALFWLRDKLNSVIFKSINEIARGEILDVGGWDFYLSVKKHLADYSHYTVLDLPGVSTLQIKDPKYRQMTGDGCNMPFKDNSFDTVINIQVLEHVFEPIKMFAEICRVLRPGGKALIVVPQTSNIHMAPNHFYNFTRYWLEAAADLNKMKIVYYKALGGGWRTTASRSFYFLLQSISAKGRVDPRDKRPIGFYLLLPFMAIFSAITIFVGLVFGIFDNTEEPPNHMMIIEKA